MPLGAAFSGIVAAWLLVRVGRRWTLALLSLPYLLGSALFVVAYAVQSEVPLFLGRMLTGMQFFAFVSIQTHLTNKYDMSDFPPFSIRLFWRIFPLGGSHICCRNF